MEIGLGSGQQSRDLEIVGCSLRFVVHWCIAFLEARVGKSKDIGRVWWRFGVLRGGRRDLGNRWLLLVGCCSLVHCFVGGLCWQIAGYWWEFGGDLVCSSVTDGAWAIAGCYWCFAVHWCIAFLAVCVGKSLDIGGCLVAVWCAAWSLAGVKETAELYYFPKQVFICRVLYSV